MSIVEIAVMLMAAVFVVLAAYLIPLLIQLRKTVAESEQLVAKMNADLPPLVVDLRAMSQEVNELIGQAHGGVEHAMVLLHAIGEVGESVQEVHQVMRGSSGTLLTSMAGMVAGLKAATQVMRARMTHNGGTHNGG